MYIFALEIEGSLFKFGGNVPNHRSSRYLAWIFLAGWVFPFKASFRALTRMSLGQLW